MTSAAKKLDRVRDRAGFTPIPPNLDINELVKSCRNFHHVSRADARTFNSAERLKEMIQSQVIDGGKPLVLENWHETPDWPKWIFKPEWLVDNHGQDPINIRDISSMKDHSFSMKHYLNSLSVLASKFTAQDYDGTKQRLYAKDIDCPPAWQKSLEKILPACTFYLSSADLMSHLPIDARAENLMCYFGHEGTYTPAHKEMCASLGQNIMVYTSPGGSSLWFMTASEDRDVVAEYWLGGLGHDIEVESHFASIEALKNAPFPVYIIEQKVGDFILVPPLAPHQVWNRGEATMKVAWNRTTAETLKLAIEESLPKARLVCRDEQYKNKAIIYETLKHYHRILSREISRDHDISLSKLKADFCMLFELFDMIILDEHFSPVYEGRVEVKKIPNEFNVTCSFCRGNIFNRFLSCKRCVEPSDDEDGDDDVYDICMECYSRGRSCACISKLCWEEQHDWNTLLRDHEKFRMQVISIEGAVTENSPRKLATAFKNIEKKSLAWVCQEQLLARPFVDVTKDPSLDDVDDAKDIERKKRMGLLVNCHVCKVRHPDWKIAKCNACSKAYCYGNLWRAFDIDPFEVLCDAEWKCPFCLGICSCGQCRKNGKMVPYEPKGTMLGASTKHVADPRSVESLVDFSRGNLTWLSENIESLKRKRSSAGTDDGDAIARSFTSFDEYGTIDEEDEGYGLQHNGEIPIDPSLAVSSDEAPKARDDDYHEPDLDGSVRNGLISSSGWQSFSGSFGNKIDKNTRGNGKKRKSLR
ncbi:putative JmjC domain protein [Morchella conica CCBAS932]|uniref:Putative JmjC domain protein n=1 Tax=Morchella conica CCBAS932 TaxID=1392247 RepID=A0A3N4KIW6_9PEZI|nr:putative JmjC domain protein [Morchella conica CCBAS932]